MRIFLFVIILAQVTYCVLGQSADSANKNSKERKIETVDFCQLIENPNLYEGKEIRTVAIYAYGGEDFIVLYCPQCYKAGTLEPFFTDLYETRTKPKIAKKLSRENHSSGTVKVIITGKVQKYGFYIDYVEKADYISREFYFPDRLSPKSLEKANCKEN